MALAVTNRSPNCGDVKPFGDTYAVMSVPAGFIVRAIVVKTNRVFFEVIALDKPHVKCTALKIEKSKEPQQWPFGRLGQSPVDLFVGRRMIRSNAVIDAQHSAIMGLGQ